VKSVSTPRTLWLLRMVRALALLAAGSSVLAGCRSSRIAHSGAPGPSVAQAAAESDGSRPAYRALGPRSAPASGSAGFGAHAVLAGGVPGPATCCAGDPRPVHVWKGAAGACGCDRCPPRWGEGRGKSYAIAAADILAYEFALNQFDRHVISYDEYGSNLDSIWENLQGGWTWDTDPFKTNQFLHPYGGAIYHGFARSAGLNFWEAFGYDVAASFIWEIAGETTPPSINDQITTPIAGSFLGEALFRSANLMLERSCGRPSTATEVGAFLVSPSTGFNRWAYGDRFDGIYPSHDPAVFFTWGGGVRRYTTLTDLGVRAGLNENVAVAAVSIDYGLPGKRGYTYKRPFDYFHLDATATSNEDAIPETVNVRGLLVGKDYCRGPNVSGIWGLYGNYEFFSPQIFKLSSTALTVGTTGQYLVSDKFALQGSLLAGIGFTSTGTTATERAERSYRYSVTPQGLLAVRAMYDDVAMLDVTAQEYFLANNLDSTRATESENVVRVQATLTVRVVGCHAVSLGFTHARRDASFDGFLDGPQDVSSISLFYTHLSDKHFGVVRP
jgi:hypothetical protein